MVEQTQSLSRLGITWAISVQSSKLVTRQVPSRNITAAEYWLGLGTRGTGVVYF